jgi:putative permease
VLSSDGLSSFSHRPWREFLKALLLFSLLLAAARFLFEVRAVVLPFALAGVFAYVLNPAVSFLERRGVRRSSAALILYAGLLSAAIFLLYGAAVVAWRDLPRLRMELPGYLDRVRAAAHQAEAVLAEAWPWLRERKVFEHALAAAGSFLQGKLTAAPAYLGTVFSLGLYVVLVPFAGFFFLRDGPRFFQSLLDACPGRWVERFVGLFCEVDAVLGAYLRAVLAEAVAVGFLSWAGLRWLGVDHAALIGFLAGAGNLAPYLGPTVGGVLGAGAAFFQFGNFAMPLKVAVLFAAVQLVDNWILEPIILRRGVNLHPAAVVFALLCGGAVGGAWWLLFAVPALCVLKESSKIFSTWYLAEAGMRELSRDVREAAARPWIV